MSTYRSPLPQNYLLSQGTLLSDFENINNFTITGSGIGEENTSQFISGTKSLKLTATSDGGAVYATWPVNLNLVGSEIFSFWVYLHSTINTAWEIRLDLSSTTDFSKWMRVTFEGNKWLYQNNWIKLSCQKSDFVSLYGESIINQMIRARIVACSHAGKRISVSFDCLSFNQRGLPRLVISFDDGYKNDIGGGQTAYSYMADRGLRGTIYIIQDYIGNSQNYLNLSDLQLLYNQGWVITNHSKSHSSWLSGQITTQAGYENEIRSCINYLVSNGMPRGAYHLAYPGGYWDANALAAMATTRMLTGRGTIGNYQPTPCGNYYLINARLVTKDNSVATVQGWIEQAIREQSSLHLVFHRIVTTPIDTVEWSIDNYKALINYIAARKIKCQTIDEWYRGLTNPRDSRE